MTRVLVIGSGATVEDDLIVAREHWEFDKVIGVNSAAIDFGPVDVHCSLHPNEYAPKKAGHFVSHRRWFGVDEIFPCLWGTNYGSSGSSGLYAIKYALQRLDASLVIVAGMPLQGQHYNRPSTWESSRIFKPVWTRVAKELRGKVYSLSGWTAELLNGGEVPPFNAGASSKP